MFVVYECMCCTLFYVGVDDENNEQFVQLHKLTNYSAIHSHRADTIRHVMVYVLVHLSLDKDSSGAH